MTRAEVLAGMRVGRPTSGPLQVHVDITNGCNAACITCWDHSPLLDAPRSNDWKRRRMSLDTFRRLMVELDEMNSVRAVVVSGMGDPLTHPHVYEMLAEVKRRKHKLMGLFLKLESRECRCSRESNRCSRESNSSMGLGCSLSVSHKLFF